MLPPQRVDFKLEKLLTREWLKTGWVARLLWPISLLFYIVVVARRWLYSKNIKKSQKLPCPVIIVGNRIVGGAGKTPMVILLIRYLQGQGHKPGILSRGYKNGDEAALMRKLTGAPIGIGKNRVEVGLELLRQHPEIDALVCDDGLQHLRLQRDLEVIVFDERGTGNGWLLPAGPLREPANTSPHSNASAFCVYTSGFASTPLPGFKAQRKLTHVVALKQWWNEDFSASTPLEKPNVRQLTDWAQNPPRPALWAVAGIAHPSRFFDALKQFGLNFTEVPRADHNAYTELPWPDQPLTVIVTEKDAIKLNPARIQSERPLSHVWVAPLDFEIEPAFWTAFDQIFERIQQSFNLKNHG
jgi:tetraacyldisaccharide 4'-kinase